MAGLTRVYQNRAAHSHWQVVSLVTGQWSPGQCHHGAWHQDVSLHTVHVPCPLPPCWLPGKVRHKVVLPVYHGQPANRSRALEFLQPMRKWETHNKASWSVPCCCCWRAGAGVSQWLLAEPSWAAAKQLSSPHSSSACPHQHRVKLRVQTTASAPWPRRGAAARGGAAWRCRSTGPDVTRTWSAVRSCGARSQLSARCVHPPPPGHASQSELSLRWDTRQCGQQPRVTRYTAEWVPAPRPGSILLSAHHAQYSAQPSLEEDLGSSKSQYLEPNMNWTSSPPCSRSESDWALTSYLAKFSFSHTQFFCDSAVVT